MDELKDILSNSNKDIDNQKLMDYLSGKLSAEEKHDVEKEMSGSDFMNDAVEGLEKIKADVTATGKLNPAYIPILQNISPGEIQHCENAQNFSKKLVTEWLARYKFKYWTTHSSTGKAVTDEDKKQRAQQIADRLCKHSDWLTHSRSITIRDLEDMKLQITDYSTNAALNEAITKYYTLLRMTLDSTSIYKIVETPETQVHRHSQQVGVPAPQNLPRNMNHVIIDFECPKCKTKSKIQAKFIKDDKLQPGAVPYPKNDIFVCG